MSAYSKSCLGELEAWVRSSHRSWWLSWSDAGRGELSDHIGAMCMATGWWLGSGQQRMSLATLDRLVARLPGPRAALGLYLSALAQLDGDRPESALLLEDLAEALFMPPTLTRQLNRVAAEPRLSVAAGA